MCKEGVANPCSKSLCVTRSVHADPWVAYSVSVNRSVGQSVCSDIQKGLDTVSVLTGFDDKGTFINDDELSIIRLQVTVAV